MVTLERKEAVEYLQRIRSCLNTAEDSFSPIQMVATMLDLEIGLIEQYMCSETHNNALTKIFIDSSGFPELPSWTSDVKFALGHIKEARMNRVKNMLPLLRELPNCSFDKIRDRMEEFSESMQAEDPLARVLQSITDEQALMLTLPSCLGGLREHPGFLAWISPRASEDSSDQQDTECHWYHRGRDPFGICHLRVKEIAHNGYFGFKFVDSKEFSKRSPFILFAKLGEKISGSGTVFNKIRTLRILTPSSPLSARSQGFTTLHECGVTDCPLGGFHNIVDVFQRSDPVDAQILENIGFGGRIINETERMIKGWRGSTLQVLTRADTATLTDDELTNFLGALPLFDASVRQLEDLLRFCLTRRTSLITDEEIDMTTALTLMGYWVKKLESIFSHQTRDELREAFQLSFAEGMQGVINDANVRSRQALKKTGRSFLGISLG